MYWKDRQEMGCDVKRRFSGFSLHPNFHHQHIHSPDTHMHTLLCRLTGRKLMGGLRPKLLPEPTHYPEDLSRTRITGWNIKHTLGHRYTPSQMVDIRRYIQDEYTGQVTKRRPADDASSRQTDGYKGDYTIQNERRADQKE